MIDYIEIKGFKSIKELKLEMKPINILIGSNGAGKSNFISFFKLINAIFNQRLQRYVVKEGADNILYYGRKTTDLLEAKMIFTNDNEYNNSYRFGLSPNEEGGLYLDYEGSGHQVLRDNNSSNYFHNHYLLESKFAIDSKYPRNVYLQNYIVSLQIFHFHDTSPTSALRKESDISDNLYLKKDGQNLASYLYWLKTMHFKIFRRIEKAIKSIAPYIDKLILEPNKLNNQKVELRWVDINDQDSTFSAYQLSDGTIRFIALATLLMQPSPPAVVIIDEPELGLHPFAIGKLSGIIHSAASKSQIIIATQSPGLINNFKPEDVIVIDRSESERQTTFNRLESENLSTWLNEYSLGDLWEKNILNAAQPYQK